MLAFVSGGPEQQFTKGQSKKRVFTFSSRRPNAAKPVWKYQDNPQDIGVI